MKELYESALKAIEQARDIMSGLSFEDALKSLDGYNHDGDLFDFVMDMPQTDCYLVGTIRNKNGKPRIESDTDFFEMWRTNIGFVAEEVFAMTETEIKEQLDRLQ